MLHVNESILTSYMEKDERRAAFAIRRAPLDVSVRMTGSLTALDTVRNKLRHLLVSDDRYILTGCDC